MPIQLLAKPVVEGLQTKIRDRAGAFKKHYGRAPKLAVVLVGDNAGSVIYTRKKHETAIALGLESENITLPSSASSNEVKLVIDRLNTDPNVDGILIQRPLPPSFKEEEVLHWILPEKDVDAFHPENVGKLALGLPCFQPCTPAGIMEMFSHYKIATAGKSACIIGRSSIVGKPMAALLLQKDATVLHCHSKTSNLKEMAKQADILVVAIGRAKFVDASFVKPGATVIDVGINRDSAGRVVGDVDYQSASQVAGAITPVPGGVGPMTITMLLQNTCLAAERRQGEHHA